MGAFARYASSGSSSSGSNLDQILRAAGLDPELDPEETEERRGIGGWLSNFVGDIGENISGLVEVGQILGGDAVNLAADAIEAVNPFDREDAQREYRTPEFARNIVPAMTSYFKEAYGSGLSGLADQLYENPLNTALDVYGAASIGGAAVGRGAARYARSSAGKAALESGRGNFIKKALPGLDPDSPLYDAGKIAEDGTVIREPGTYAGGVRKRLLETSSGGELLEKPLSVNPVKRRASNALSNLVSHDIDKMPDEIKTIADDISKLDPAKQAMEIEAMLPEYQSAVRLYNKAKELGVTRLDYEPVAQMRLKIQAAKEVAGFTGNTYRMRNMDMKKIMDAFTAARLSKEELKAFHRVAQGIERVETPGTRTLDEIRAGLEAAPDMYAPDIHKAYQQLDNYIERKRLELDGPDADVETLQREIEAAEMYAEDLSEVMNLTPNSTSQQVAMARLRLARHDLVHESVEAGLLSYEGAMARQYGPLLIEDNRAALAEVGKRFDYDALAGDNPDYWRLKRSEFKQAGHSAPIYYPHLDPRRFSPSEFTLRRGARMEKLTGHGPYTRNQYRNYLDGTYLTSDPVEAYARRAAHMRKIIETQKFVEHIAQKYGRRIDRMGEVNTLVERVFNPKGVRQLYRTRGELDDAIAEFQSRGMSGEEALKAAIEDVETKNLGKIDEMINDPTKGELYAIPKAVADKLESYSRYQLGPMGKLFWDRMITSPWRALVLSFSPRWIVNNLLGNIMFLKMQGGRLLDVAQYATSKKFRNKIDEFIETLPDDVKAQLGAGIYSSAEIGVENMGAARRSLPGMFWSDVAESKGAQLGKSASHRMQHWNNVVEQGFRKVSALTAVEKQARELGMRRVVKRFDTASRRLERIAAEGLSEADAHRMVDEVNYFFNDYNKLSSLERNVIRRFLVPFWSFFKHQAKLALSYPFQHPERAFAFRQLAEVTKEMDSEFEGILPDFLENARKWGVGAGPGETRFLNARAAVPISATAEMLREPEQALSMLHPIPKGIGESLTGRDFLTGYKLTAPGVVQPFGSEQQYKGVYDDDGDLVNIEPTTVRLNPFQMVTRSIPQYQLAQDAISMIPGVGPPGVGSRYSTGQEKVQGDELVNPESFGRRFAGLLGLSTFDVNVEEVQERELQDRRAALIQLLRMLGEIPPADEE